MQWNLVTLYELRCNNCVWMLYSKINKLTGNLPCLCSWCGRTVVWIKRWASNRIYKQLIHLYFAACIIVCQASHIYLFLFWLMNLFCCCTVTTHHTIDSMFFNDIVCSSCKLYCNHEKLSIIIISARLTAANSQMTKRLTVAAQSVPSRSVWKAQQ